MPTQPIRITQQPMFFNPLFFDLIKQLNGLFPVTAADSSSPTPASIISSKSQQLLSINDGLNDQQRNKNQQHEQTLESSQTVDSSKIDDRIVGDNDDLICTFKECFFKKSVERIFFKQMFFLTLKRSLKRNQWKECCF